MVTYHFLVEGHAFARVAGDHTVELDAGDVVIFPHGDAHQITSDLNARPPFPDYGINAKIRSRDLRPLRAGWRWLLAYLLTDEAYAVVIRRFSAGSAPVEHRHWF